MFYNYIFYTYYRFWDKAPSRWWSEWKAITGVQDSIIVEVDAVSTTLSQEYSYDAWGRRRDKDTWQYTLSGEPDLLAGRGFTAHEELPWFNLVNMNGRLYDPTVGRFLSADPVVQSPTNTQNFNRYSYCLNNPLKYTDPSGYRIEKFMREDSEDDMYDETQDGGGLWSRYHNNTYGGGSSGGNSSGYTYNWLTGRYYDASGYEVSYNEVHYNYVLPNARAYYVGKDAQVQFKLKNNLPLVAYAVMDGILMSGEFKGKTSSKKSPKIIYQEAYYQIKPGFTYAADADSDIGADATASRYYSGFISVKQNQKGKWYAEGFVQTFPKNNSNLINANMRLIHNGNEIGYQRLSMNNEIGAHFYDSKWQQDGYARFLLPENGNVKLIINIVVFQNRWWGGSTGHLIYQGYVEF